jgi:hypothetical protein
LITLNAEPTTYTDTGARNLAIGYQSLKQLTYGHNNTAIGYNAGQNVRAVNSTADLASHNTAIGAESLNGDAGDGSRNTAVGSKALNMNKNGDDNTVLGYNAGNAITDGSENICIGSGIASGLTTGYNNIYIGYGQTGSIGTGNYFNTINLGNNDTANFYCKVPITTTSDERLKKDIEPIAWNASDYISNITPVSYLFKTEADDSVKRVGFVAQDLKRVENELGLADICVDTTNDDLYRFKSDHMVAVLVKAVQELLDDNQQLKNRLDALEQK